MMFASGTEDLFGSFELSGPGADAHAPQELDIKRCVDPAIEIAASGRNSPCSL
jgi:hypothetical protein